LPGLFLLMIFISWLFKSNVQFFVYRKFKAKIKKLELKFNFNDMVGSKRQINRMDTADAGVNQYGNVWILADIQNVPQKGLDYGFRLNVSIFKNGYRNQEDWYDEELNLEAISKMDQADAEVDFRILQK
jgi:hypothetical protein